MLEILMLISSILFLSMTLGVIVGLITRNMGVVDIFWGLNIFVCAWVLYLFAPYSFLSLLLALMVSIWALRLMGFLFFTRIKKGEHDHRYTQIEEQWKGGKMFRMAGHFYMQAAIQVPICFVFLPRFFSNDISSVQIVAIVLFVCSLLGETVADLQLYRFKVLKKIGVCRTGLWAISRHPNLFFEWCIWVSLALFGSGELMGFWAWLSPLSVWVVVRYITGPYTERLSLQRRGDAFRKYQADVPMLIPNIFLWFRRPS